MGFAWGAEKLNIRILVISLNS